MSRPSSKVINTDVKKTAEKAAFSPLVEALTRLGYGVRGAIYMIMGVLAIKVSLGKGGSPPNQQAAIAAIGRQPAGLILLWVVLLGLISYSLWGVIRAVFDPLHKGHDLKGLFARAGYLASAVGYGSLALFTYGFIMGTRSSTQNGATTQHFMSSIMSRPWGSWAIGIIGLAVIAAGLHQMYKGFNASFDKQFQTYAMNAQQVKLAIQVGRFGTAARGFVFAMVGLLMCLAAYKSNPSQPVGFAEALSFLLSQPYGIWLLGIVAVGLIAFGVYSMLSAAWFRLKR